MVKKCLKKKSTPASVSIKPEITFENPTIANSFANYSNDSFINESHFRIKKDVVKITQRDISDNQVSEIIEEEFKEPVIQNCATGRPEVSK